MVIKPNANHRYISHKSQSAQIYCLEEENCVHCKCNDHLLFANVVITQPLEFNKKEDMKSSTYLTTKWY